jgi:hypothetical protein
MLLPPRLIRIKKSYLILVCVCVYQDICYRVIGM